MTALHAPRGARRSSLRRGLALAAALAGTAVLTPAAAHAGTYPMYACDVPGINLPVPSRAAWTDFDTTGAVQHHENCTTQTKGGSLWFQINYPTGFIGQNTGVGVELQIPATGPLSNISIARVTDWTETALTAQGPNQPPAYGPNLAPAIGVPPGGSGSGFDGTGSSGVGHDSGTLAAATKQYQLGVLCSYFGGGFGNCTLPTPFLRFRGIRTTLSETIQPAGTIDGGSLAVSTPVKGVQKLNYTATDAESGVEKTEVLLDDTVVATDSLARDLTLPVASQTGECSYVGLQACPASHTGLVNVDTTKVPDGAYELVLRVTDAAGNSRTTVGSHAVVVDNVPDTVPPTPPTPGAGPTGNAGPTGQVGAAGAAGAAGPAGASGVVLHLNGRNGSIGARLRAVFSSSQRETVRSAYGKKVLINGQLTAPSGQAIVGARVAVSQQDKLVGARMVAVGEVVTDAAGTFHYVATATRSRTIRFGYRAHLEDTEFSTTKDVGLGVIAKIGLTASPKALRNGKAVVFRGTVAGAPSNARKVVELQVRKGAQWMTFRSTRLRNGRFTERYRFTRTHGRVTYAFRARLREEAGFPFLTSHSKTVKVTVRG